MPRDNWEQSFRAALQPLELSQNEMDSIVSRVKANIPYLELRNEEFILDDIKDALKEIITASILTTDTSAIDKAIQMGRFHSRIKYGLGEVGLSETLSFEIQHQIFERLDKDEYVNEKHIENIIQYLRKTYPTLSTKARTRFQYLDKTFLKAGITDALSIETHVESLFNDYINESHTDRFSKLYFSQSFCEIYDEINTMDELNFNLKYPGESKDSVIKKHATKAISEELAPLKLSFNLFVNRAVDRVICRNMMTSKLRDDLGIQCQIESATINEGLCRPLLVSSIIKDLEMEKEKRDTAREVRAVSERIDSDDKATAAKVGVEKRKKINFAYLHNMLKTFSILKAEQEAQTEIGNLEKLNKHIKEDSDITKTVKSLRGFAKAIAAPNALVDKTTGIIDKVNTIHSIAINTEKTVQNIKVRSGLFSIIAGGLNVLLLPLKYAFIERRWPNTPSEWGKIGTSIALLVLGALAFAAVGGAAAAGGLFLGIACIGYVQAILDADKINRKILELEEKEVGQKERLTQTVEEINTCNDNVTKLIAELQKQLLARPNKIDFKETDKLTSEVDILIKRRRELILQYINISADYLSTKDKLERNRSKKSQPYHKFKRFGNVVAGGLAIVGAIGMFFFPPVGSALLIASAILSLTTILTEIAVKSYHKFKEKKIAKQDVQLDKALIIKAQKTDLFEPYDLYHREESTYTIEHSLVGKEISKKQCGYEKQKALLANTPFHQLFSPAPPETKDREKVLTDASQTFFNPKH